MEALRGAVGPRLQLAVAALILQTSELVLGWVLGQRAALMGVELAPGWDPSPLASGKRSHRGSPAGGKAVPVGQGELSARADAVLTHRAFQVELAVFYKALLDLCPTPLPLLPQPPPPEVSGF